MTDQPWKPKAACRGMDAELFFPPRGELNGVERQKLKALCADCPVQTECLEYALSNCFVWGWWGGKSERERRAIRMQRRRQRQAS